VGSRTPHGRSGDSPDGRVRAGGAPGEGARGGRAPDGNGSPDRHGRADSWVDRDHGLYRWRNSPSSDMYHGHHEIQAIVRDVGPGSGWPTLNKTNYVEWVAVMRVKLQVRHMWEAVQYGDGGTGSSKGRSRSSNGGGCSACGTAEIEALHVNSTGSSTSADGDRDNELKLVREAARDQAAQWAAAHPQGHGGGSPDEHECTGGAPSGGACGGRAPTAAAAQTGADAPAAESTEIAAFTGSATLPPQTGTMVTMRFRPFVR
jgi:hypothetical protein